MPVEIQNRQRKLPVNKGKLSAQLELLLERVEHAESELSVMLVSDKAIRKLNRDYRGRDEPTDVLSFSLLEGESIEHPHVPVALGDIVISVERAASQARDRDAELGAVGYRVEDELVFLSVHGLLHLLGHDHMETDERERMEAEERRLFGEFSSHPPREHHQVGSSQ